MHRYDQYAGIALGCSIQWYLEFEAVFYLYKMIQFRKLMYLFWRLIFGSSTRAFNSIVVNHCIMGMSRVSLFGSSVRGIDFLSWLNRNFFRFPRYMFEIFSIKWVDGKFYEMTTPNGRIHDSINLIIMHTPSNITY